MLEGPVAQKTIIRLVDDIDGTEYGESEGETLTYGLDGTIYEIDLKAEHAQELRDLLAPYISVSRGSGTSRGTAGGRTPRKAPSLKTKSPETRTYDLALLRHWAAQNGIDLPARGRIKQSVIDQYLSSRD